jgi:hypothetical protein
MAKVEDKWPHRGHSDGLVGQSCENARDEPLSRSSATGAAAGDCPCISATCRLRRAARTPDWPFIPGQSGHVPSIPTWAAEASDKLGANQVPADLHEVDP